MPTTKIGLIEEANNGTILLNEITDLDITVQSKLLRFLQDKAISRVGGTTEIPINVRIIITSTEDLEALCNLIECPAG